MDHRAELHPFIGEYAMANPVMDKHFENERIKALGVLGYATAPAQETLDATAATNRADVATRRAAMKKKILASRA